MTLKYDKLTKRNRSEYIRIANELIISHSELQTCPQSVSPEDGEELCSLTPPAAHRTQTKAGQCSSQSEGFKLVKGRGQRAVFQLLFLSQHLRLPHAPLDFLLFPFFIFLLMLGCTDFQLTCVI